MSEKKISLTRNTRFALSVLFLFSDTLLAFTCFHLLWCIQGLCDLFLCDPFFNFYFLTVGFI